MRVGVIGGSFKPYHKGHHGLVLRAAAENDRVGLYASMSGRDLITWDKMSVVWTAFIMPMLPPNVTVHFVKTPVRSIYELLGEANERGDSDEFAVYADPDDNADRFPLKNQLKYFGGLHEKGLVRFIDVPRTGDFAVSATRVRASLKSGDILSFMHALPDDVQLDVSGVWDVLRGDLPPAVAVAIPTVVTSLPSDASWLDVKKQLLNIIPGETRAGFTTRDPHSKKHHPFNPLEQAVRRRWSFLTGHHPAMPPDKMLGDPSLYE